MTKQNFTPAGVKAKTTELYALTDALLNTQVNLMRADFRTWLNDNFLFDIKQSAYLAAMDGRFLTAAGGVTGTAAGSRLEISLEAPTPPGGFSSKYIIFADGLTPVFDSVQGYSVTGSVRFTIGYVN